MKSRRLAAFPALIVGTGLLLVACSNPGDDGAVAQQPAPLDVPGVTVAPSSTVAPATEPIDPPRDSPTVTKVAYDWSLLEGFKFRYAGAAVEADGERHLYYCANIDRDDRHRITDHIVTRSAVQDPASGEWFYGDEAVALFPGEDDAAGERPWDWRHACDPSVVAGTFRYQVPGEAEAELFEYALFYLGIEGEPDYIDKVPDGNVNQIGWAVAHDLAGPWHKVGTAPLITSNAAGFWGVGQPSAVSIDDEGEVLLFYTRIEGEGPGTYRQQVSLLDAANPVLRGELELTTDGLELLDGSPDGVNFGGAFVFDRETERFFVIRSGRPFPKAACPDFIADHIQVASIAAADVWSGAGKWTVVTRIGPGDPPRIFDGGWVRNPSGGLVESNVLEALVSESEAVDKAQADQRCGVQGLNTYRIQGARISKPSR